MDDAVNVSLKPFGLIVSFGVRHANKISCHFWVWHICLNIEISANTNAPMNELIHWEYVVREVRVAQ